MALALVAIAFAALLGGLAVGYVACTYRRFQQLDVVAIVAYTPEQAQAVGAGSRLHGRALQQHDAFLAVHPTTRTAQLYKVGNSMSRLDRETMHGVKVLMVDTNRPVPVHQGELNTYMENNAQPFATYHFEYTIPSNNTPGDLELRFDDQVSSTQRGAMEVFCVLYHERRSKTILHEPTFGNARLATAVRFTLNIPPAIWQSQAQLKLRVLHSSNWSYTDQRFSLPYDATGLHRDGIYMSNPEWGPVYTDKLNRYGGKTLFTMAASQAADGNFQMTMHHQSTVPTLQAMVNAVRASRWGNNLRTDQAFNLVWDLHEMKHDVTPTPYHSDVLG